MPKNFATTLALCILLCACQPTRYLVYNFADIRDYRKFPAREISAADSSFSFYRSKEISPQSYPRGEDYRNFDQFLEEAKTVAFLIIHQDSIKYERYFNGYQAASTVPSFSVAKSVISILIGAAINDGYITSVQDPITRYIPELDREFNSVSLEHLLQMTSGLKFNENYYLPFSDAATFYYGRRLRKKIARMELASAPGKYFHYSSGSTQLLGLALERALPQGMTISAYLERRIWHPLGMEYPASWSIDQKRNGLEKAFCCLNARARDFAKLGRLYLREGNWQGRQIIPADWVHRSTALDTDNGSAAYYQYQWWRPGGNSFLADGFLGQYIFVNPAKDLIIVRLGRKGGGVNWWRLFQNLSEEY